MNVTEQSVKPKNTRVAYHFERYPMDLYDADGKARKVKNEAEEDAALAQGFTENPPAIPQSIAVHAMTTQPAIQSGYDALKRELEAKTVEFNRKFSALQTEHQALQASYLEVSGKLLESQQKIAEMLGPSESPAVEPEPAAEANPFANLQPTEPAVKSRAALLADELKAAGGKTKSKAKAAAIQSPDK